MRTITPEPTAILRSRFQAAGDGYAGRFEIDSPTPAVLASNQWASAVGGAESYPDADPDAWFDGNDASWGFCLAFGDLFWDAGAIVSIDTITIGWKGEWHRLFAIDGGPSSVGPWTEVLTEDVDMGGPQPDYELSYDLGATYTYRWWRIRALGGENQDIYKIEGWGGAAAAGYATATYRPKRITINRNLRMGPDQATIELANEDGALGFGPTSIVPTNSRCRVYQWFGNVANEVLTFTGVIDKITDSRDPLTTALECRSMAGPILVDQTFSTTAPQQSDETGAVRTEANGVYLNREVDYVAAAILELAGWPSADVDIADTSFVLDEFIVDDGASWWDTLARLVEFVGYTLWDDEDAVIHLKPLGAAAGVDDPLTADYEYEIGIA